MKNKLKKLFGGLACAVVLTASTASAGMLNLTDFGWALNSPVAFDSVKAMFFTDNGKFAAGAFMNLTDLSFNPISTWSESLAVDEKSVMVSGAALNELAFDLNYFVEAGSGVYAYSLTAYSQGSEVASETYSSSVPDGGFTAMMLSGSFLGMSMFRRRFV